MWGQICLDCNTNNYAKIPKMGVNAPTWEGSKDESEILHQLCVDLPAYSKTKEQWLSKQWLTINFSLRFKFKGRQSRTSMRPLAIGQEDQSLSVLPSIINTNWNKMATKAAAIDTQF